jgi:hypothetical protein
LPHARVQLAGKPAGGGNAELIEVAGKADSHGGDEAKARGRLVIHEIELLRSASPMNTSSAR